MLDEVLQIKRRGLITLERARLLSGGVGPLDLPYQLGEATKLTVYVGRQDRVDRTPAYLAVCDLLHRRGIAGASVLLGGRRDPARPPFPGEVHRPQRGRADDGDRGRRRSTGSPPCSPSWPVCCTSR